MQSVLQHRERLHTLTSSAHFCSKYFSGTTNFHSVNTHNHDDNAEKNPLIMFADADVENARVISKIQVWHTRR